MTDAKPATDEELDAGLVERAREIIFGQPSFYTDTAVETLRVKRALLSLPIPAAALNALARGEATVVPKKPDAEQESAGGAAIDHPSVFMGGPLHRGRRLARNTYEAMLAASPYIAPRAKET